MKRRLSGLAAVAIALAVCPRAFAKGAPFVPNGQSSAIAVHGRYVYVVQNGMVYKLSSRDLKPLATTKLQQPGAAAAPARAPRVKSVKNRRKSRASRRHSVSRVRTPQPAGAAVTEAPLPR